MEGGTYIPLLLNPSESAAFFQHSLYFSNEVRFSQRNRKKDQNGQVGRREMEEEK